MRPKIKDNFLQNAIKYITENGPSTANELHDSLQFTARGKPLRDTLTPRQCQQILARCSKLVQKDTEVYYRDTNRNTTYTVSMYHLVGDA